mgnify:CR=1 FL=1|jgi:hypothetical protein
MNNSARIIKNFIEFQRNVFTEKAIHSPEEFFVTYDDDGAKVLDEAWDNYVEESEG